MKKVMPRILAFILVFALAFPVAMIQKPTTTASAASVALSATKRTMTAGTTYTMVLKNSTSVSKKSFKSSNTKVAKVNGNGVVTAVKSGTATITCTVTLKTGGVVALKCAITVKKRIPATKVVLNNAVHNQMNAHIIEVGNTYDFNVNVTPWNSTDSTYFTIADSDIASVTAAGVVTAKKEGVTVLEARCGLSAADAKKTTNKVVAKTYILVTKKTVAATPTPSPSLTPTPTPAAEPKAVSVDMVSSNEIKVVFSTAIDKSTVIDNNGNLITGAVTITPGSGAALLGILSAKLSTDCKTLYISTVSEFSGTYVVTVFNKVMTKNGKLIAAASFQKDFKDTTGPSYVGSEIADNGYVCKINFNEAIDISELAILSVNGTNNQALKSRLTTVASYVLSADKKSLSVDLSACGEKAVDVMVTMIGIKDLKGNLALNYQQNVFIKADMTEKAVANIIDVKRESKKVIVATFDQPIAFAGYAIIDGNYLTGVIDSENTRQVRYTLINTSMTGSCPVIFSGYRNFNMVNSGSNSQTRTVDFTLDTTPPMLVSNSLISETVNGLTVNSLVLEYNKKVTAVNGSGSIGAYVRSTAGNVYSKTYMFTSAVKDQKVILTFAGQALEDGTYSFTIPSGLVVDSLENASQQLVITVDKQNGNSSVLPQPIKVLQDDTNPSKIKVTFNNKLDIASAQTVSNYLVNGSIAPISAMITDQSDGNAVVELTFASGIFASSGLYMIQIKGLKGFKDSYGIMNDYISKITLVENTCPTMVSAKLTSLATVQIAMTKDIIGTGEFQVYMNGSFVNAAAVFTSGNNIIISLPGSVSSSTLMTITKNGFKDANQNAASIPTQFVAEKAY